VFCLRQQEGEKGQTTEGTAVGTGKSEPGESSSASSSLAETSAARNSASSVGAGVAAVDASVPVLGGSE
jgi:hypothetical protein